MAPCNVDRLPRLACPIDAVVLVSLICSLPLYKLAAFSKTAALRSAGNRCVFTAPSSPSLLLLAPAKQNRCALGCSAQCCRNLCCFVTPRREFWACRAVRRLTLVVKVFVLLFLPIARRIVFLDCQSHRLVSGLLPSNPFTGPDPGSYWSFGSVAPS